MNNQALAATYGQGRTYTYAPNEQMTFFVSNAEFDLAENELGYLGGPPLHIHPQHDETHYLVQGKLRYQIGEQTLELESGDYIHIPHMTPHGWVNLQQESARLIVVLTPGGSEEFWRQIVSKPLDAEAIGKLAQEYGIQTVGPPLAISLGLVSQP